MVTVISFLSLLQILYFHVVGLRAINFFFHAT